LNIPLGSCFKTGFVGASRAESPVFTSFDDVSCVYINNIFGGGGRARRCYSCVMESVHRTTVDYVPFWSLITIYIVIVPCISN
jgi:hypothetical protein